MKVGHEMRHEDKTRDAIQRQGTRCDTKVGRSVEVRRDAEAERGAKARDGRGETRCRDEM
jgi:hypothetical protein